MFVEEFLGSNKYTQFASLKCQLYDFSNTLNNISKLVNQKKNTWGLGFYKINCNCSSGSISYLSLTVTYVALVAKLSESFSIYFIFCYLYYNNLLLW